MTDLKIRKYNINDQIMNTWEKLAKFVNYNQREIEIIWRENKPCSRSRILNSFVFYRAFRIFERMSLPFLIIHKFYILKYLKIT